MTLFILPQGVRAVVCCTAVKVVPKEGDTPDRAKYMQGIKFYDPEIVGDTPEVGGRGRAHTLCLHDVHYNTHDVVVPGGWGVLPGDRGGHAEGGRMGTTSTHKHIRQRRQEQQMIKAPCLTRCTTLRLLGTRQWSVLVGAQAVCFPAEHTSIRPRGKGLARSALGRGHLRGPFCYRCKS